MYIPEINTSMKTPHLHILEDSFSRSFDTLLNADQ